MDEPEWSAWVDTDGSYRYRAFDDTEHVWHTSDELAADWWEDSAARSGGVGEWRTEAHRAVVDLLQAGHPAALHIIQSLIDAASDEDLDLVGAGPLEDLLSHNHHGLTFVDEIERRARRQPRFRMALAGVWLARDVPDEVRDRLSKFGARLLSQS